ncbi:uncharacterized protein LOC118144426 [Callithrix jacchus]
MNLVPQLETWRITHFLHRCRWELRTGAVPMFLFGHLGGSLHHCILEAHNLSDFTGSKLDGNLRYCDSNHVRAEATPQAAAHTGSRRQQVNALGKPVLAATWDWGAPGRTQEPRARLPRSALRSLRAPARAAPRPPAVLSSLTAAARLREVPVPVPVPGAGLFPAAQSERPHGLLQVSVPEIISEGWRRRQESGESWEVLVAISWSNNSRHQISTELSPLPEEAWLTTGQIADGSYPNK